VTDLFDHRPHVQGKRLNVLPDNPDTGLEDAAVTPGRFPRWLHRKLPSRTSLHTTKDVLCTQRLPTVCEEANCPNLIECWSHKTATFLTMGHACTRSCGFCNIAFSPKPQDLDPDEPRRIAQSIEELGLRHAVITMVARDDLPDGGASHLIAILSAIHNTLPGVTVEVLTSDLAGNLDALDAILAAKPAIFNHNIETVRTLTPRVRHKATYDRTLAILAHASQKGDGVLVKSGMMVGLGETEEEVYTTLQDLHQVGCKIVTIGHYLQPSHRKLRVKSFITPEQFQTYADYGHTLGIPFVYSGPFVRSSYNAAAVFEHLQQKEVSHVR